MKKIIIIGSCNTDMVIKTARIPVPGETIIGGTFFMNPGGKGANQAVAVARLGGVATFVAKTGNDMFGRQSVDLYQSENINTDYVFSDPQRPSGVALISVDAHGENSIVVASGANAALLPKDIDHAREAIETSSYLLMQLEVPMETIEYSADIASKKGVKIVLNPAPAAFLPQSLIEKLYLITPNKTEAEMLTGIKVSDVESAKKAAKAISTKGVENVIITLGSDGSVVKEKDNYYHVEAYKVETVDTTAAGDTFNGALCVALSEGKELKEAVEFAAKAAALSVTRMGAQSSIPYRKEVLSLE